jgi:imidazolonepropionase-like amidohydrolase
MAVKHHLVLAALVLVACGENPGRLIDATAKPDLVIRHVNVVDVVSGGVVPDQLIAIKDGQFTAVMNDPASWQPGPDVRVIDGTGKYALPGLWDMHVHVCWSDTNATLLLPALLRHGITGVRDMGGDLHMANAFKQRIKADPSLGPDIMACGPIIDGDPPVFPDFTLPLSSNSDVAAVIDSLIANGADFIKVYSLLDGPEFQRIADHCTARGIPFAGHLSELVDPARAIRSGQRSVEHLNRLDELWNADPARLDSIASLMEVNAAWSCPTLVVYDRKARAHEPSLRDTTLDALVPGLQGEWQQWHKSRTSRYASAHAHDSLLRAFGRQLALVKHMHDRGVPVLAGSDLCGQAFVYPGIGLHEELELLVQAGLATSEALCAATIRPAEFFGTQEKHGSIAAGKQADLLLLTADPLLSIRNTRAITTVVHRGAVIDLP